MLESKSHWEKINKEKFHLKWRKPFDLLVLVLPLLSTEHGSFVPRKWLLQRARWIRFTGLNFWSRSNEPNTMQQDVGLTYWGRLNESLKMIFLDLQVGTLGQEPFDFVPSCWDRSNNSPDWGSIAMYMGPCSCLDKGPYPYCYHWWTCKSSCIHWRSYQWRCNFEGWPEAEQLYIQ